MKNINLYDKYITQVLKTWGGENQKERSLLGIIEEIGEYIGKEKKQLRGDDVSDIDFKKELGDIIYYIRIFQYLYEIKDIRILEYKDIDSIQLMEVAVNLRYKIKKIHLEILINLYFQVIKQKGYSFEEILQINKDKLQSRKKRNVIKGNGDNR